MPRLAKDDGMSFDQVDRGKEVLQKKSRRIVARDGPPSRGEGLCWPNLTGVYEAEGSHDRLYDPMRSLDRRQRCFDSI